ncbi:hypothetical protein AL755_18975 [Arthrobacter sp. ERGS1:01]|uniref:winged helix DNA-binding domain-containing protein n=1 Tax=Arthrobacter sp. ERGS1:01 TaxID=1704044 RepID=UPI0006B61D44|nr:winged helix DNA-binding domain-containing protein [Arthrobacter sp. ERGS1:01]ALE07065.1 hypothetical protein AL755_18975 [Arthrobacter sp. ERGS1:01]
MTVTPATLARLRLAAQWILPSSTSPTSGPADVVRWMTALQGQDFPGALWSIGLRSPGSTREDVEGAFNRGEIVRSWPLRGTLHVSAAEDLGWILSLTSERMLKSVASRHRQLGITTSDLGQVREVALSLLEADGSGEVPRAGRDELFAAFEAARQPTQTQRGMHLLWLLCVEGTLVQGPITGGAGSGTAQYFVRTDQWITAPRTLPREAALAELALRYFRGHGPATVRDFQWWAKLTLADIKIGLAQAGDQLESVQCEGATYYLAPETAELLKGTVPGARSVLLLPGFDEYLLGYTDRSAALAPEHADLTVPGGNGVFRSTVVTGGKVAGTWRKAPAASGAVVLSELFGELSPNQVKALEKSAEAYAKFLTP